MSNYQRLISYIYTYESGLKGKNVGFAKLETRNSQCRLTVNVKKVFPGGSPLGVYLLSGDGEQRIGTLFSRNGTGEFRALLNADQIEGSGRPLREFYGLSIHDAENGGHSYTTIWEDVAISAAEAAKEDSESSGTNQTEIQSGQSGQDGREEAGMDEAAPDTREEQPEMKEECLETEKGQDEAEEGCLETEKGQAEAEEERLEAEEGQDEAEEEQPEAEEETEKVRKTEREEKERSQEEGESQGDRSAAKGEEREEKAEIVNMEWETAEAEPGSAGKAEEAEKQERNSIRETLLRQSSLPAGQAPSSSAPLRAEARSDRRSTRPRSRRRPDGGMSAREWAESLAAQSSLKRSYGTETAIQADDRAFIPLHDLDDSCSHQRMWARLRRKYPKILAFDYEPGCEILTIKPQDIGLLPREAWIFGNNSFLLHGYYSYRYLILARLENPDGEPRYLLGVPGHYCSNEKYMASMFGFPDFILSKKQPSGDDCFGYWYTDVRVGD